MCIEFGLPSGFVNGDTMLAGLLNSDRAWGDTTPDSLAPGVVVCDDGGEYGGGGEGTPAK